MGDLETSSRKLPQNDTGLDAGIGVVAHDRDPEPARAKHLLRTRPVHADQIGHDVGGATFAPVDKNADRRARSQGRWLLGDDRVTRIATRPNLGDRTEAEGVFFEPLTSSVLGLSDQGRD